MDIISAFEAEVLGSSPSEGTRFIIKHKNATMKLMKRILLTSLLFLFVFFLIPTQVQADLLPLVQCGITPDDPCTFCDFFGMINRIIQLVMRRLRERSKMMSTSLLSF